MKAAEFLRVCLPRFQERRANGEDLRLPIVYGVPKAGSRSVEERFTPAYWALEKLIAVLVNRENRAQMLRRKKALEGEKSRLNIGDQLQWLCESLDVTWRDLYPAKYVSTRSRFIKTRNKIFHSKTPIDGGVVFRETRRMSLLFERLILKALGWSDLDGTGPRTAGSPLDREL